LIKPAFALHAAAGALINLLIYVLKNTDLQGSLHASVHISILTGNSLSAWQY
jgi:hypothetical protein